MKKSLDLLRRLLKNWSVTTGISRLRNERNYNSLSATYEAEQNELESRIAELNAAIKTERENDENAVNFVDLIKQYADIDELTQALLNTLIDRIEVHEPEDLDGELIQKLDVYYKFVGRLD